MTSIWPAAYTINGRSRWWGSCTRNLCYIFQKSVGCFSDDSPFTLQETEKPQSTIEVKSVMVHVHNESEV